MRKIRAYLIGATTLTLMAMGLAIAPAASADGPAAGVIFDSVPSPLPGNVVSWGFEATSTSEFGDYATFDDTNTNRLLQNVDVLMSSWGCQDGTWNAGTCSTTTEPSFSHPIAFTIYENDNGDIGSTIATVTNTFSIPYRPSADPDCSGGRWQASDGSPCFNGLATKITFDFSSENVTLPDSVIYGVAYSTTHYGTSPLGEGATCYTASGGCGYDALNVGSNSTEPLIGMDDDRDGAFLNATSGGVYCDSGTGGTGTFRLDTGPGCWTGQNPHVQFNAESSLGACAVLTTAPMTLTLQDDCTTEVTIRVPNGWTFDGNGFSITGVEPAGGHFLGAVIQGEAGAAAVTIKNLTVTVSGLTNNFCDEGTARLRGILFDGVGGSITNNTVIGIKQGTNSGCQEGNGIEVRNEPFSTLGPDKAVTITGNTVTDYQKGGIVVNGSVVATIRSNTVVGAGPINYIAQNGIQVGFGATATVRLNSSSRNNYTPKDTLACGFLIYQADGVNASSNNWFNNERNQCNFGKGGTFKPSA